MEFLLGFFFFFFEGGGKGVGEFFVGFFFPLADAFLFNTESGLDFILNDSVLLYSLNRGALLFN